MDQARARLAFAATELIEARAAGGRTDALRIAERAVDQAERLLAAIGRADDDSVAARVAAADDFITTRRGHPGADAARTGAMLGGILPGGDRRPSTSA